MSARRVPLMLAALAAAAPVGAQQVPDNNNVAERFREQIAPTTEREREEALLTGDTDLVLLRRARHFTLTGTLSAAPTSNAFLSPDSNRSDVAFQLQTGLRVGTTIGGAVDLYAEAGALDVRYARFGALDYDAFVGAAGARARLAGFDLGLAYQPAIIYSRGFGARQLTQHQFAASISRTFQAGQVFITPIVTGQRVESSPSDYRNWAASADLAVSHPFRIGRFPAAVFASGGFEYRDYDSYFRDLVGSDRRDKLLRGSLGFAMQMTSFASLRLAYDYRHSRSTSDVNGYRAHGGGIGLTAAIRF